MSAKTKKGNTNWTDTSVRGIINNEKYIGDILMGKTFTVDPISKRRLDNFGEEEKYYIKNHHEPIISREQFAMAQEILGKRSKNFNQGRMKKYSQQYAFSSMMKCAYCGGNITRRRWHSETAKQKDVWFCVTAIKKSKKGCTECKAVEEKIIENKISKLLDLHLEDKIDKISYEEKYNQLKKDLQDLKIEKIELDKVEDEEKLSKKE